MIPPPLSLSLSFCLRFSLFRVKTFRTRETPSHEFPPFAVLISLSGRRSVADGRWTVVFCIVTFFRLVRETKTAFFSLNFVPTTSKQTTMLRWTGGSRARGDAKRHRSVGAHAQCHQPSLMVPAAVPASFLHPNLLAPSSARRLRSEQAPPHAADLPRQLVETCREERNRSCSRPSHYCDPGPLRRRPSERPSSPAQRRSSPSLARTRPASTAEALLEATSATQALPLRRPAFPPRVPRCCFAPPPPPPPAPPITPVQEMSSQRGSSSAPSSSSSLAPAPASASSSLAPASASSSLAGVLLPNRGRRGWLPALGVDVSSATTAGSAGAAPSSPSRSLPWVATPRFRTEKPSAFAAVAAGMTDGHDTTPKALTSSLRSSVAAPAHRNGPDMCVDGQQALPTFPRPGGLRRRPFVANDPTRSTLTCSSVSPHTSTPPPPFPPVRAVTFAAVHLTTTSSTDGIQGERQQHVCDRRDHEDECGGVDEEEANKEVIILRAASSPRQPPTHHSCQLTAVARTSPTSSVAPPPPSTQEKDASSPPSVAQETVVDNLPPTEEDVLSVTSEGQRDDAVAEATGRESVGSDDTAASYHRPGGDEGGGEGDGGRVAALLPPPKMKAPLDDDAPTAGNVTCAAAEVSRRRCDRRSSVSPHRATTDDDSFRPARRKTPEVGERRAGNHSGQTEVPDALGECPQPHPTASISDDALAAAGNPLVDLDGVANSMVADDDDDDQRHDHGHRRYSAARAVDHLIATLGNMQRPSQTVSGGPTGCSAADSEAATASWQLPDVATTSVPRPHASSVAPWWQHDGIVVHGQRTTTATLLPLNVSGEVGPTLYHNHRRDGDMAAGPGMPRCPTRRSLDVRTLRHFAKAAQRATAASLTCHAGDLRVSTLSPFSSEPNHVDGLPLVSIGLSCAELPTGDVDVTFPPAHWGWPPATTTTTTTCHGGEMSDAHWLAGDYADRSAHPPFPHAEEERPGFLRGGDGWCHPPPPPCPTQVDHGPGDAGPLDGRLACFTTRAVGAASDDSRWQTTGPAATAADPFTSFFSPPTFRPGRSSRCDVPYFADARPLHSRRFHPPPHLPTSVRYDGYHACVGDRLFWSAPHEQEVDAHVHERYCSGLPDSWDTTNTPWYRPPAPSGSSSSSLDHRVGPSSHHHCYEDPFQHPPLPPPRPSTGFSRFVPSVASRPATDVGYGSPLTASRNHLQSIGVSSVERYRQLFAPAHPAAPVAVFPDTPLSHQSLQPTCGTDDLPATMPTPLWHATQGRLWW